MLTEIFQFDRRLRIESKKIQALDDYNEDVFRKTDNYLDQYANFYSLSPSAIVDIYNQFVIEYSNDLKNFLKTGCYPYQLEGSKAVDRISYDIALLVSPTVTYHRHKIISNLLSAINEVQGKVLVVGIGSGFELNLLGRSNLNHNNIYAYDLVVNDFVKNKSNINIYETEFKGNIGSFDYIFAIELLEHLVNPFQFLSLCSQSLLSNGILFTTTAKNIPQQDHLFNFTEDHEFERNTELFNFKVMNKEVIPNSHVNKNIKAENIWYKLQKI